ncbi:hypothetical protein Nepgr_028129 [Nepenthes gracilis]|uniref:non-specific serine/threonine protein kinase n=1 Tax=Nepenthes gracilis TaxID=150966 RepID=A0AAD3TCJ9_NEPGR|nr:hypothetical protein Nepgr_028129 [Nepenthes gracilis]
MMVMNTIASKAESRWRLLPFQSLRYYGPRATLEDMLPSSWGSCSNLEMVNLAQNYFTGGIPNGLASCKKLLFLDLSLNMLNGELDDNLQVPCMTLFDVSGNALTGSIPRFHNSTCVSSPLVTRYVYDLNDPSSAYLSFFANKTLGNAPFSLFKKNNRLAIMHNFGSNKFSGSSQRLPIAFGRLGRQIIYAYLAGENSLGGSFPKSLFDKCGQLGAIIVNVSSNKIFGPLPVDIDSICKSLVLLDASGNMINGSIPPTLGALESLVALDLSKNMLQGQIPVTFGQMNNLRIPEDMGSLRNLTVLLLDNNKLSGQIPSGLANMKTLRAFNVSFNNLSGPIPLNVPSSDQHGAKGDPRNYAASPSGSSALRATTAGFTSVEIAAITSASVIFSVLVALVILFIYTRRWNRRSRINTSVRKELTIITDVGVLLTFETVVQATGNFSMSNCISNGGSGATYKAEISPGVLVAVKRLSVGRFQGVQQFHVEIKTLGRLRHPNLVTLIGYHASETEMFLIYNYLPGGNLEKFIQERSTRAVDWRILHKIALDIACPLAYLHDQCMPRVLHHDVKPSNILLNDDFNAYLSDFRLA